MRTARTSVQLKTLPQLTESDRRNHLRERARQDTRWMPRSTCLTQEARGTRTCLLVAATSAITIFQMTWRLCALAEISYRPKRTRRSTEQRLVTETASWDASPEDSRSALPLFSCTHLCTERRWRERYRPQPRTVVDHGGARVLFFHDTRRKRVSVPGGRPPTSGQAAAPVPAKLSWMLVTRRGC